MRLRAWVTRTSTHSTTRFPLLQKTAAEVVTARIIRKKAQARLSSAATINPASGRQLSGLWARAEALRPARGLASAASLRWVLLIAGVALVAWIRLLPLSLGVLTDQAALQAERREAQTIEAGLAADMTPERRQSAITSGVNRWRKEHRAEFEAQREQNLRALRAELTYQDADGASHVFLGDFDSYHWLRMARNYLRTGTTCDAVVAGQCRDTYANAPVGRAALYNRSLHIAAIVALHRLITFLKPAYPLEASSYLVPVLVGILGVFPTYALGARLAGELGGLSAALLAAVNPLFLTRSLGSDDDVWNIVLPMFVVWAASEAGSASSVRRQVALAVLAGIMVGLDAATWTGWRFAAGVVLLALAANLLIEILRGAIGKYSGRSWNAANPTRAAVVLVVFYVAAGSFAALTKDSGAFGFPLKLITPLIAAPHSSANIARSVWWPNVFSTVAELAPPNLGYMKAVMGGRLYFFASLLGLMVLALPKTRWRLYHFALLGGAAILDWRLVNSNLGRVRMLALLTAPLAAAILIETILDQDKADDRGAALMVIVWYLSALFLSYQAVRLVMMLVPAFALAFAVALGRSHGWAESKVCALWSAGWIARPALLAVFAATLWLPMRESWMSARGYLPFMTSTWWNTLNFVREKTPPDAIVNNWWDYGYWTEYLAQRRVIADGASLQTHIPYWTAKALAAPSEKETAGLLRMLDCGSDATPDPEGRDGAYGKLVAYGFDELKAQAIVSDLVRMGRSQARTYLAEQKLGASAQDDVLRSTHCDPAPAYLVLSSVMKPAGGWWSLATWDFRRAYVMERAQELPEAQATSELMSHLGYSGIEARVVDQRAASLKSASDEQRFMAPGLSNFASPWLNCKVVNGLLMTCAGGVKLDPANNIVGVVFPPDNPADARLLVVRSFGQGGTPIVKQSRPGTVFIAGAQGLQQVSNPGWEYGRIGVLIDQGGARVRLGSPTLLRSTFSNLMYLDGRYQSFFEKAFDQTGFAGEHVTLWKINWQRLEAFD